MSTQPSSPAARQIVWPSVITVISAAILIGAEVFGAAFAGGWALAILLPGGLDVHPGTGPHRSGRAVRHRRRHHGRLHPRGPARRAVHAPRLTSAFKKALRRRHNFASRSRSDANLNSLFIFDRAARLTHATLKACVREISPQPKKIVAKQTQNSYFHACPISHVPVVVCQSVGIRTRGRTAAKG